MDKLEQARLTFERNIAAETGRGVPEWVAAVAAQGGLSRHGEIMAWLKTEHGLKHGHANHIAKAVTAADMAPSDDPVAHLFEGGKDGLRPLYDRLVAMAQALGPDVEIAPKKANVSLRRRRQFALLQPTTRTRLDLGLILKDRPAAGRLEPSGSFNAMFTHRVRLETAADVDADVAGWLAAAYDEAG